MSKTYRADGSLYKIGIHNKVYRWDNHEWVSSTKTVEEMLEQAERNERADVNKSELALKNSRLYMKKQYAKKK